jgi:flavin-dependent dehydrogenase
MASSIHLAKAGLNVLCIEPAIEDSSIVGESLDWSAPELLRNLGLPIDQLIAEGIATWKRHIVLQLNNGSTYRYLPGRWLGHSPWNVDLCTLHVDRTRLRQALTRILLQQGVTLMDDRVTAVDQHKRKVIALTTQAGKRISSSFYVDASGFAASLFPRFFHLRSHQYGPRKVALWSYFDVSDVTDGTILYADDTRLSYLDWVWEIPVQPQTISVGYVAPAEVIKALRQHGTTVDEIYRDRLSRIPRFQPLLHTQPSAATRVVSFRCGAYRNICGANWLVVGDAASMVDPMTSNGVTAALRQAEEASRLITRSLRKGHFPRLAAALYSRRALEMARFFNCGIERLIYASPVRNSIGVNVAGQVYTIPAWLMNLFYSRMRPRGLIGTALFCVALQSLRVGAFVFYWLCRRFAKPSTAQVGFAS